MDWRMIVAVAASVLIIVVGMLVQQFFFSPKPTAATAGAQSVAPQQPTAGGGEKPSGSAQPTGPPASGQAAGQLTGSQTAQAPSVAPAGEGATGEVTAAPVELPPSQPAQIVRETDLLRLTFLTDGATLSSIQLKTIHNADGSPVELVLDPGAPARFFDVAFGDAKAAPIRGPFVLHESSDGAFRSLEFWKNLLSPTGVPFTLKKTFLVARGDYMVELRVSIENSTNEIPALGSSGLAYTLGIGPQIGPPFLKLDGRNDYRNFVYWWLNPKGKWERKQQAANGAVQTLDQRMSWVGVVGKYFAVIAVPSADTSRITLDSKRSPEGKDHAEIFLGRSSLKAARTEDVYRFYLGPLKREVLARYNDSTQNPLAIKGLQLDQVITSPMLIGWLADALAWILDRFFQLIPNYGVAIILLTLLTKLVFFPLTFRSSESMARMAALNPKMQEIRERLKGKPELMNREIAELYRREKVNPLSGCLPLLLQLPIFFALYNVFNTHFELRGASFIPGWIPDLSQPESVWSMPFTIPLLGWSHLRLLPFIMLGTQLLSSKVMQPPSADRSAGQMKLLNYAMPIVFLFILYDMPSGLTLYWTVQNVLSIVQQLYINYLNNRKRLAAAAVAAAAPARKRPKR